MVNHKVGSFVFKSSSTKAWIDLLTYIDVIRDRNSSSILLRVITFLFLFDLKLLMIYFKTIRRTLLFFMKNTMFLTNVYGIYGIERDTLIFLIL